MSSASRLPDEIVFDILTRLPVKSICRFKCVSKSWLSTISTAQFVDSHFDRSRSHPKLLISILTNNEDFLNRTNYRQSLFIADRQETEEEEDKKGPLVLRRQVTLPVTRARISDALSVAGLTLSIGSQDRIAITNPITKASFAFPRAFPNQRGCRTSVSFGFDPVEGKHKIVESQCYETNPVERIEHSVVSLSDSGNWRSVQGPFACNQSHELYNGEVCIDGVIYSAATEMGTWRQCIVAFDVRSEKFQAVTLSINGRSSRYTDNPHRYMEYQGKLAIVDYPLSNKDSHSVLDFVPALDLWVMEDFENQVWSFKSCCLPLAFSRTWQLVGNTIDGELIFVEFGNNFTLHLNTPEAKTINLSEEEDMSFCLYFFNMKTGNLSSRQVRLPPEYPLTGGIVRLSASSHVERM